MSKKLEITKCFSCKRVLVTGAKYCGTCGSRITITLKRKIKDTPEVHEGPLDRWMS